MTDKAKTETAGGQPVTVNFITPDKAAEAAQAVIDGQNLRMDYAKDGGRYIINGQTVDANGNAVKGKPDEKDGE